MVEELFEYKEANINDWLEMAYFDCKLKKQIGFHKVGEYIPSIHINFSEGTIMLYTKIGDDESYPEIHSFSLQIQ